MRVRPVSVSLGLLTLSLALTGCKNCPCWGEAAKAPPPPMIGSNGTHNPGTTTAGTSAPANSQPAAWNSAPARGAVGKNVNSEPNPAQVPLSSANPHTANPGRAVRTATPPQSGFTTTYPNAVSETSYSTIAPSESMPALKGAARPAYSASPISDDVSSFPESMPVRPASAPTQGTVAPLSSSKGMGNTALSTAPSPTTAPRPLPPLDVRDATVPRGTSAPGRGETQYYEVQGTRPTPPAPATPPPPLTSDQLSPLNSGSGPELRVPEGEDGPMLTSPEQ